MEEGRITVEGKGLELPKPFFMMATENPVEFEGTFPLPEAQKDRFFLSTRMGYPPGTAEKEIMESQRRITHPVTDLKPITDTDFVLKLQKDIIGVHVDESLVEYIMNIVEATRQDERLKLGASPRASMALYKGAQALAAIRGRDEVVPADIQELVQPVLWKRISVKSENLLKGLTEERAIEELLERIEVPPPKEAA